MLQQSFKHIPGNTLASREITMTINKIFLEKVTQDYQKLSGKFFTQIPIDLIQAQTNYNELTDLINIENNAAEPDAATIAALRAQRVRVAQRLSVLKSKYGIKS